LGLDCTVGAYQPARQILYLLAVNGGASTSIPLSPEMNYCDTALDLPGFDPYADTISGYSYMVSKLVSSAYLVPTTTTSLGMQLYNATTTGAGNDTSFDLPQISDVTPQLDQSFSPAAVTLGDASTLTFTVTNVTDNTGKLLAKNGWSFTETLPAGLRVAPAPNIVTSSSDCPNITVTATAGATAIQVSGDLPDGVAACTISVDVRPAATGAYTSAAANVAMSTRAAAEGALWPPGSATLTVSSPIGGSLAAPVPTNNPWMLALLALALAGAGHGAMRRWDRPRHLD
jgi:uncharacterized repeat protein (TIGR01451 family)